MFQVCAANENAWNYHTYVQTNNLFRISTFAEGDQGDLVILVNSLMYVFILSTGEATKK